MAVANVCIRSLIIVRYADDIIVGFQLSGETWRNQPIEAEHPYVYLDGIVLKRSWAGESATSRYWWRSG
jgi:hypothetical protein